MRFSKSLKAKASHKSVKIHMGGAEFILRIIIIIVWTLTVYMAGTVRADQYVGKCKSTPFRMERQGEDVIACVIVVEEK